MICDDGIERARATGVLWTGYGVGMLIFRELIRYVSGDLTPRRRIWTGCPNPPPGSCRWSICTPLRRGVTPM